MSSDVVDRVPELLRARCCYDDRFCEACGTQLIEDDTVAERDHRESRRRDRRGCDRPRARASPQRGCLEPPADRRLGGRGRVRRRVVVGRRRLARRGSPPTPPAACSRSSLTSGLGTHDASPCTPRSPPPTRRSCAVPWRPGAFARGAVVHVRRRGVGRTTITVGGIGDSRAYWIGTSSRLLDRRRLVGAGAGRRRHHERSGRRRRSPRARDHALARRRRARRALP